MSLWLIKPAAKKAGPAKTAVGKKVDGPSQTKKAEPEDVEVSYFRNTHISALHKDTFMYYGFNLCIFLNLIS